MGASKLPSLSSSIRQLHHVTRRHGRYYVGNKNLIFLIKRIFFGKQLLIGLYEAGLAFRIAHSCEGRTRWSYFGNAL